MVETEARDRNATSKAASDRSLEERRFSFEKIGIAVTVFGAILASIELYSRFKFEPEGKRADQTLTFMERFDSDRLVSARREINALLDAADEFIDENIEANELTDSGEDTETVVDLLLVEFFFRSESGDVSEPLVQVVSFFGQLQVCIETELCDRSTAHDFLDTYASTFWQRFEPVVERARTEGRPGFASEMERFVLAIEK